MKTNEIIEELKRRGFTHIEKLIFKSYRENAMNCDIIINDSDLYLVNYAEDKYLKLTASKDFMKDLEYILQYVK